ncbi:MAG: hypothetical protein EOR64_31590, partial [Mesorhizobium sp.]
ASCVAFLHTPLCPAGHLPPCGGDVRQDRGGWAGTQLIRIPSMASSGDSSTPSPDAPPFPSRQRS